MSERVRGRRPTIELTKRVPGGRAFGRHLHSVTLRSSSVLSGQEHVDVTLEHAAPEGWVLYDDSCGFCSRWVPFWGSTLQRRGFGIAPLQADWVQARLALNEGELLRDLRLLLRDDRQIVGAEVYRYVMRRVWWAYPAYWLSVAPLLRGIFDWSYRMFATYRYRVSAACGLRSRNAGRSVPDKHEL